MLKEIMCYGSKAPKWLHEILLSTAAPKFKNACLGATIQYSAGQDEHVL